MRSALTAGNNSREWYINVTWTPSASQQGANIFCYTATDNFGCVSLKRIIVVSGFITISDVLSFTHYTYRLSSEQSCITLVLGGEPNVKLHSVENCRSNVLHPTPFVHLHTDCSGCSSVDNGHTYKLWEWHLPAIFTVWSEGTVHVHRQSISNNFMIYM